jgi:hypothetical protein
MLHVEKKNAGKSLHVGLSGTIDEKDNLDALIGNFPAGASVQFSCSGVKSITSFGVRGWMKALNGLKEKQVRFEFAELSSTLVGQLNCINNFLAGAPVKSVMVDYECPKCRHVTSKPIETSKIPAKLNPVPCSKCGASSQFADVEDEYFSFARSSR